MKVSTKGRYALRLMVELAERQNEGYVALRDISMNQEISMKYLEQIVSQLSRAGLLRSARGPQGGYMLARPREDYTVGDILRAMEGNFAPVACLEPNAEPCPRKDHCATLSFWVEMERVMEGYIDSVNLEGLLLSKNIEIGA